MFKDFKVLYPSSFLTLRTYSMYSTVCNTPKDNCFHRIQPPFPYDALHKMFDTIEMFLKSYPAYPLWIFFYIYIFHLKILIFLLQSGRFVEVKGSVKVFRNRSDAHAEDLWGGGLGGGGTEANGPVTHTPHQDHLRATQQSDDAQHVIHTAENSQVGGTTHHPFSWKFSGGRHNTSSVQLKILRWEAQHER